MTRIPVITCFNNQGGVGKTSLVYHLAWMFSSLGKRVLAIELADILRSWHGRLSRGWKLPGEIRRRDGP